MESTLKRTWAEIDLDHLTHNFEVIRRRVGDKVKLLGVVKADGYGHGAVEIAKRLEQLGAGYLAVSNIDECEELRDRRCRATTSQRNFLTAPSRWAGR